MGKRLASALALCVALLATMGLNRPTMAQTPEQKIWTLLGDTEAPYVSLGEADFRTLGAGFDLPDGGKAITGLAERAPGGAFDPRDVAKLSAAAARLQGGMGRRALPPLQPRLGHRRPAPYEPRPRGEELSVVHHHERRRREPLRVPRRPQEPSGLGAVSRAKAQRHDREHSRQFQIWRLGAAGDGREAPARLPARPRPLDGRVRGAQCDLHQRPHHAGGEGAGDEAYLGRHPLRRPLDLGRDHDARL